MKFKFNLNWLDLVSLRYGPMAPLNCKVILKLYYNFCPHASIQTNAEALITNGILVINSHVRTTWWGTQFYNPPVSKPIPTLTTLQSLSSRPPSKSPSDLSTADSSIRKGMSELKTNQHQNGIIYSAFSSGLLSYVHSVQCF